MRLSIIVPVYNSEKTIKRCLRSVLSQKVKPYEIIVVDDGSIDKSRDIVEGLSADCDIIRLIRKNNGGVSSARNCGLRIARGDYVMFLDSDDALYKGAIERIQTIIRTNKKPDLIKFGYIKKIGLLRKKYAFSAKQRDCTICDPSHKKDIISNLLSNDDFSAVWNIVISSKNAKKTLFDESKKYGEDRKYNADLISKSETIYIESKPLYIYYVMNGSATHSRNVEKEMRKLDDVLVTSNYIFKLFDYVKMSSFKECAILALDNYVVRNISKLKYLNYKKALSELKDHIGGLELESKITHVLINNIKIAEKYDSYRKNKLKYAAYMLKVIAWSFLAR